MAIVFDGNKEAQKIKELVKSKLQQMEPLSLTIIRTMERKDQVKFTTKKQQTAQELGIECQIVQTSSHPSDQEILQIIDNSQNSTGILIQLPLHSNLDKFKILNAIPYRQDVEGFCSRRAGEAMQTTPPIYSPVAMGIMHALTQALELTKLNIEGSHTVLVGNSYMIGKPLSQILADQGSTVTICHSKTKNLQEVTSTADIIISGVGKAHLITANDIKEGVIAIDAGVSIDKIGKLTGDFAPDVQSKASFITPCMGGIGPLTIAYIFQNLVNLNTEQNQV